MGGKKGPDNGKFCFVKDSTICQCQSQDSGSAEGDKPSNEGSLEEEEGCGGKEGFQIGIQGKLSTTAEFIGHAGIYLQPSTADDTVKASSAPVGFSNGEWVLCWEIWNPWGRSRIHCRAIIVEVEFWYFVVCTGISIDSILNFFW